jgi:predicted flap endonuclease-1-like 5' DNA nuclease
MYLLTQNWIFFLLAALIGGLIAWVLGFCNCNRDDLEAELGSVRGERDDLAARFAAGGGGAAAGVVAANANHERKIASLEAELAEARVKANAAPTAATAEAASSDEDVAAMKWRNRYLEARVKFLEDQSAAAPMAAGLAGAAVGAAVAKKSAKPKAAPKADPKPEAVSNENFTPSSLAKLSGDELEAATLAAAGKAKAPPRSRKKSNPDDLLLIDGVGPKNNAWLNEQGIYYFHQIATMNIEQVAWLSENLPTFGSRVYRENWVAQCTNLARGKPARG